MIRIRLNYNMSSNLHMMKWYNPTLTPDSLWLVWADTELSDNLDILTLTLDRLWPVQAATSGLFTMGIRENTAHWVIQD